MADGKKILIIAEKESFIVRVLSQKIRGADVECEFARWDVNSINKKWLGTALVTLYLDDLEKPGEEVLHFLGDRLAETGIQMVVIGEKNDLQYVLDRIRGDLIYKVFYRPLDNAEYLEAVGAFFRRLEEGEFRKSILIVDDDPNYMSLVREWLKGTYKVAMVTSGMQALRWLGKNKADLILLDHEMPVTSGPQVLGMLRSEEETKRIPVMFLTGKGDKQSVMSVVALKPEGYFLKTIQREELLEKLEEFFILHP
ncbi:MAG: response regulator [Lachnospiraceae bacterium]|nr:response regulator [Lachnospiraceae bacterium]